MYPFRMYGRVVQLLRYKVTYNENFLGEDGDFVQAEQTVFCSTIEEANEVAELHTGAIVESIDNSVWEWMDGIEVSDVPDTFAEAVKIYGMGKEVYLQKVSAKDSEQSIQLRADIDFLAAMQGVDL